MKKNRVVKKVQTGDKVLDRLYAAAIAYTKKHGGTAVVVGGVALVQDSPLKYNYGIMVRMTGKPPTFTLPNSK